MMSKNQLRTLFTGFVLSLSLIVGPKPSQSDNIYDGSKLNKLFSAQKRGDYEEVIKQSTIIIKTAKFSDKKLVAGLYGARAAAKSRLGKIVPALQDYKKAIELFPDYWEGRINRGRIFISLRRPNEALNDFNSVIKLHPDNPHGFLNRANVWIMLKKFSFALDDLTKAIKLAPENNHSGRILANAYTTRGDIRAKLNQHDRAVEDFSRALDENSGNRTLLLLMRSNSSRILKKFSSAQKDLVEAEKNTIDPHYRYMIRIHEGNIFKDLNNYDSAIVSYSAAVSMNPHNIVGYISRANVKKLKKDYKGALGDLKTAVDLSPRIPIVFMEKAEILYELGRYADALDDANKAIGMGVRAHFTRARIYDALERPKEAIDDYTKALSERMNSANVEFIRARLKVLRTQL